MAAPKTKAPTARRAPTAPKPAAQVNPDLLNRLLEAMGEQPKEISTVTKTAQLVLRALRSRMLVGWSVVQLGEGRFQVRSMRRGTATISSGELRTAAGANPALAKLRQLGLDDAIVAPREQPAAETPAPGNAKPKADQPAARNGAAPPADPQAFTLSGDDITRLVKEIKDNYDDVPVWSDVLPLPDPSAGRSVVWSVITPAVAQQILDECDQDEIVDGTPQRHNRKPSKPEVRKDALRIRGGNWQMIHQGIAFDTNGHLRDGKTRLLACIEADRPVPMQVAYNQRPDEFAVYDISRRRSGADVLYTSGIETNTSAAWSANAMVHAYHQGSDPGSWRKNATTTDRQELTFHLQNNPGLVRWVDVATDLRKRLRKGGKQITAPIAPHAAALFVCEEAYKGGDYDGFVDGLAGINDPSRDGLRAGDPRRAYYDFLLGFSTSSRKLSPVKAMAVMIKALNAWNQGATVEQTTMRWRENERMPTPWVP